MMKINTPPLTAAAYKAARKLRGSMRGVSARLEISFSTIFRRESGESPITREMMLALLALPVKPEKDRG